MLTAPNVKHTFNGLTFEKEKNIFPYTYMHVASYKVLHFCSSFPAKYKVCNQIQRDSYEHTTIRHTKASRRVSSSSLSGCHFSETTLTRHTIIVCKVWTNLHTARSPLVLCLRILQDSHKRNFRTCFYTGWEMCTLDACIRSRLFESKP